MRLSTRGQPHVPWRHTLSLLTKPHYRVARGMHVEGRGKERKGAAVADTLRLELNIDDPDVLAWLSEFDEEDRPAKAGTALRVGVLALRQAAGFVDRQAIKDEGKQLMTDIELHVTEIMRSMVGPESSIMKTLDPKQADGLVAQLHDAVDEELGAHGGKVLSAFSLDDENSPLSRLVAYVRRSQDEVRKEFSLDEEGSGMSRLLNQLSCALAEHEKANSEFRKEVTLSLEKMAVRKQSEARSTLHGDDFEDAVTEFVRDHAARSGDIVEPTGNTTGQIKNCKIGDCTLELGPDSASGGEKIVFEAKEDASYTLTSAREEIEKGRRNRQAQVGVFVWSARYAPADMERLRRYGRDIVVVWDSEDPSSDVFLDAAVLLAKGLLLDGKRVRVRAEIDFDAVEKAIEAVAKRAERADQVRTWGQTVENAGSNIVKEMETTKKDLERQVDVLRDHIEDAKHALASAGS